MSNLPHQVEPMPVAGSGSLTRIGGGLGIAAAIIGLAAFVAACAGYDASLKLSFIPLALSIPGLILAVIGGTTQKNPEDTHVMAAVFPNILGIVGGLVMMAAWLGWTIFQ